MPNPDAEQLAARYDFNVEALKFEYDRRCFGSFTTTLDGSPHERDRYCAAWGYALARREEQGSAQ
jgi:hypothetical protein